MSTEPPYPGANGHVPWGVYLDDRRDLRRHLARMDGKLDKVLDRVGALEQADAHDDGAGVAQDAAERAVVEGRKDRRERLWDLARTLLTAVLAVVGTLIAAHLGGA